MSATPLPTKEPWPDHPGWEERNCGCCAGIQWGGEEPIECRHCHGTGRYALHIKSGTAALYPGGPLLGYHKEAPAVNSLRTTLEAQEKE